MIQKLTISYSEAFGVVLSELRHRAGLTQEELSFQASLDRSYISLLERGLRSPTLNTMTALARVFGISLTEFIEILEAVMARTDERTDNS